MADDLFNVMSSADQIRKNHELYKDKYVDKDKELITQETFLKLLVAEMSNQDPLEPTSNTEFISQLAQFSSMQYMQDASKYAMANYASGLVGKTATASKFDGPDLVIKTGVVEKVVKNGESYTVTIDGVEFDLGKVTSVVEPNSSAAIGDSNALANKIIQASTMIGNYATVKVGEDPEGKDILDEGFIYSIQVKDGKIKVLIGDSSYDMDQIVEVTWATIVEEDPEAPADPDAPKEPENTENTESTDKVEADKSTSEDDVPDLTDDDLAEQLKSIMESMM